MITVILTGGLGNQMFQYALGKHLSVRHKTGLKMETALRLRAGIQISPIKYVKKVLGYPKIVSSRNYSLDIFNIDIKPHMHPVIRVAGLTLYTRYAKWLGYNLVIEKHFHYDKKIIDHTPDNSLLMGYWQSPYYFQDIEPIIRKEFTFKKPVLPISQTILQDIQTTCSVCMHVRRGDYLNIKLLNVISSSTKYFHEAATLMASKLATTPHFFIFSDDLNWCRENIELPYPTTFVDKIHAGKNDSNHLQLMKNCAHFILSNSSFSWWATWLCNNSKKIIIAPKKWFSLTEKDTSNLVPSTWIRL